MSQSVEYLDNTAEEENYSQLISEFVSTNPQYYESRFEKIGAKTGFSWTFNIGAALLGPVWYGMRSLWSWGLPFLLLEIFAWIQIARGTFGNLAADAQERITQIEGTLEFRNKQLAAAIEKKRQRQRHLPQKLFLQVWRCCCL